jgi:hypothetical protein
MCLCLSNLFTNRNIQTHIVDALINAFPDAVRSTDETWGRLPLHIACICACSAQVLKLLLAGFPDSARLPDKVKGRLPVHYTCLYGSPFEIAILVDAEERALVYKDLSGKTPLELAQYSENPHREAILRRLSDKTVRITESLRRRRRDSLAENDESVAKASNSSGPNSRDKKKGAKQKSKRALSQDPPNQDLDGAQLDRKNSPPRHMESRSKDRSRLDNSSNHSKTKIFAQEEDLQDKMSDPSEDGENYDGKNKKLPENKDPLFLTSAGEEANPRRKNAVNEKTPSLEESKPPKEGESRQGMNSKEEKIAASNNKDEQPSTFAHDAETPLRRNSVSEKNLLASWNMEKCEVSTSSNSSTLNSDSSAAPFAGAKSAAVLPTPFVRSQSLLIAGSPHSKSERGLQGTAVTDNFVKVKRVSSKKLSKSARSNARESRRVSELLNGASRIKPSSKDDIDIETTAQQRNNRKLQMLMLHKDPRDSSPEDYDLTSVGASSLPVHIQSKLWSGSLRAADMDTISLRSYGEARSQSHADSSDQEISRDAAKEIASKDVDLFKLEAQIRNLDVRKEALSQECTHIYKSVALKQEDVDKSRDKIITIQRKLIEYQAKLEKEQGFWELAVTSIEIQRETLVEHESKMDQVERDRKTLVTKKEQLLEERKNFLAAAKASSSAQVEQEKSFNDSSIPIFDI